MKFKKSVSALVFLGLFFFQPAFESGHVCRMLRAVADSSGRAEPCVPSLYPDVDFRWAFAARSIQDGKRVTRPVTEDMVLKSGDRLKMMVELEKRCYVYLFHEDRRTGIKLLFPYTLQQFTKYYRPGRKYYIPRADGWFKLDNNPGKEKFYLIASARRLKGLEKAYLEYASAQGDAKIEQGKALLERIEDLCRERRMLCTPAERPVTIGGALRSVKKVRHTKRLDIAGFADEIVSEGFTARTYTIEHE